MNPSLNAAPSISTLATFLSVVLGEYPKMHN